MRKALTGVVSLAMLIGTVTAATGTAVAVDERAGRSIGEQAEQDIKDRILAIPGMSLIEEKPYPGYRFFLLNFEQPVDHRKPWKGTFQQRISLLHKDTERPTVFQTSGYGLRTTPSRSEPTTIVDGNQVSMEYRFFTPSRPQPADWSKLTIWQAASDQHRIFTALKRIYGEKWLSTGGSKGGMTATYYERFYPRDMDAVVAYVAPNDVVNDKDAAYDRFFENVGTAECRTKLNNIQRESLIRRGPMQDLYRSYAEKNQLTFNTIGSLDKAFEAVVLDFTWGFWQYQMESACAGIPVAKDLTDQQLYDIVDEIGGWKSYTDQGLEPYVPYYYQAGVELGSPDIEQPHLKGLSRYGYQPPRNFVPREIPMKFQKHAMADIDRWVRGNAHRMMFVNGANDPWSAEPFRLDRGSRDSYVYTQPGGNHGARISALPEAERTAATATILRWAGVAPAAVQKDESAAKPLARPDSRLDKVDARQLRLDRGLRG
ncbi:S28 family serine protease [Streptomyces clavuligerus]|uniref:Secreted tripeptidyl aminopeptidase n=1 Tax=Streptomyces clavuligerus TaxID=1901 RepID=B5H223_STRCL|nr:S28 family serine protease [Streptomyces clavuligerus]EDY52619.1 secreted tripeptidyl aminopeptidase [Streptomyces clavuligerus]EFG06991.1 Secreted tripeptidyl aminopeptidase [Streptomyces clavuligerus]MBY6304756.1 aminopeptidase [Streptomyces clavuligerus]QCS07499.1 aminopeptidase [Streptomyces clavuligerus]QPJ93157.1 aminopeptidase [Streptomyces clavuligerus]